MGALYRNTRDSQATLNLIANTTAKEMIVVNEQGEPASYWAVGDIKASLQKADHGGWLLCDGREYDTDKYPLLYTLLEDNHLPDLRETHLEGAGVNEIQVIERDEEGNIISQKDLYEDHDGLELKDYRQDTLQNHRHESTSVGLIYLDGGDWVCRLAGTYWSTETRRFDDASKNARLAGVTRPKSFGVNFFIRGE